MSQANVETARRWIDLANRGDEERMAVLVAPDIQWFPAADQPDAKPFRGREAFLEYASGSLEVFDQYVIEPSEYLDLGEYVIVAGRVVGRGRESRCADGRPGRVALPLPRWKGDRGSRVREQGTGPRTAGLRE
jgi:ketosteroid isomerase-like protein